jgi:pimeloyl-ACP methyl ester carboxylesterase
MATRTAFHRISVDGLEIAYREAGPADGPALLLLHGFPTAGHMFRDLIPLLSDRYRVIAPDLPGFGQSSMPLDGSFEYTFANLATIVHRFIEKTALARFALYVFDYGAPVGLRLAMQDPTRITAIISQNGNAYEEGLSKGWDSLREYWRHPTDEYRESLRAAFTPEATRYQYVQGASDSALVSPDGMTLDDFYLARPGAHDVQLKFFLDYGTNVEMYPAFHEYFRKHQPPLLAVWGKNDPYFIPAGAEAFRNDLPNAEVQFFDAGHFALETHHQEIAQAMRDFLGRHI